MATLKEHQNAMVDLLANGSAVPASTTRLAHALHDVLGLLLERDSAPHSSFVGGPTATLANADALLRAKLAAVAHQRDAYKARCESLEAEVTKRDEMVGKLQRNLETWKNRI